MEVAAIATKSGWCILMNFNVVKEIATQTVNSPIDSNLELLFSAKKEMLIATNEILLHEENLVVIVCELRLTNRIMHCD